jgi:hypothetical protein
VKEGLLVEEPLADVCPISRHEAHRVEPAPAGLDEAVVEDSGSRLEVVLGDELEDAKQELRWEVGDVRHDGREGEGGVL